MSWITAPFAWLLKALYDLTGSYGWAVVLFGVVVNLILLPFMAKSKKSMMRTSRLQPRITELQRRHEGNQQKLNEEMAKLYREEKINPMSGCLWSLIPFPILIALYSVIRQPLTKMMGLGAEAVTQLTDWVTTNAGYVAQAKSAYQEIQIADLIHQNWDAVTGALGDYSGKLLDLDYSFIGLNMGQQPSFKIWTFDWSNKAVWLPALGLFLIPIISALLSWLSMKISTSMTPQPAGNQQAAATNKTMMLMMPLVSLWICYTMPAALGIYWIVNSILGILRDVSLTKVFNKQLDKLDAERIAREKERDAELERKRLETERLKAAGETVVNPNTSKKKIQASQKQKDDERKAAAMREERAARRERLGVEPNAVPESQVGNRRYARGRAYVPDRYSNPEAAEEQTLAAAAESEFAPAIDETIPDDIPAAVEETAAEETAAVEEASAEAAGEEVSEGAAEDDSAKTEE